MVTHIYIWVIYIVIMIALQSNTEFPCILENNKFIFQVLEMSLNFTKSGEKNLWFKYYMPVEENFDCRRKSLPVHSLDIPC